MKGDNFFDYSTGPLIPGAAAAAAFICHRLTIATERNVPAAGERPPEDTEVAKLETVFVVVWVYIKKNVV